MLRTCSCRLAECWFVCAFLPPSPLLSLSPILYSYHAHSCTLDGQLDSPLRQADQKFHRVYSIIYAHIRSSNNNNNKINAWENRGNFNNCFRYFHVEMGSAYYLFFCCHCRHCRCCDYRYTVYTSLNVDVVYVRVRSMFMLRARRDTNVYTCRYAQSGVLSESLECVIVR